MSKKGATTNQVPDDLSEGVMIALSNGFTLEQALEAETFMGHNPDMILSYLI